MKSTLISALSALVMLGCNQGKNSEKADAAQSNTVSYKALDGTRAKVTFKDIKGQGTVTVESANGKKIELDKIETQDKITRYGRAGITAVAKGDSLILDQNGTKIPLVIDK